MYKYMFVFVKQVTDQRLISKINKEKCARDLLRNFPKETKKRFSLISFQGNSN